MSHPISSAEADLRRRLAADPNNGLLACQLGELLRLRGDLPSAEIQARNAVRLLPESPEAHRLLGLVFGQSHRNAAAEGHLRRAAELAPPDGVLLASLGINLSGQGRYSEADAFFQQAAAHEPNNARFLLAWANSAELNQECEQAEELIAQAERIQPGMIEAVFVKSDVLARRKHHAEALALLDAYKEILCSPKFFYLGLPGNLKPEENANFKLAERLAFFLWCSVPDEPLLKAANEGILTQPSELDSQVKRMLKDKKSRRWVQCSKNESV